jgi:L-fucose isomerase-like protein
MKFFGVDIDPQDTTELIRTAKNTPESEISALGPRLRELFGEEPERNVLNERSIRLYLALRSMVDREQYTFYTLQSFPGLGHDYTATCFAQSMMLEDGFGTSTLGDFITALTVWLLTQLSP